MTSLAGSTNKLKAFANAFALLAVNDKEPHYVGWFLAQATRVPAIPLTLPVRLPPATWRCKTEVFERVREVGVNS